MHLDDNNGQHSDHGELGSGTINWQALAPFLKGFDGMLSFEIKGLGDLERAVLRSKTFVENLLKEN
jgi:sugar phosphate isomerase/epimerase